MFWEKKVIFVPKLMSFIHWFVHSFTRSFVYSFIHLFSTYHDKHVLGIQIWITPGAYPQDWYFSTCRRCCQCSAIFSTFWRQENGQFKLMTRVLTFSFLSLWYPDWACASSSYSQAVGTQTSANSRWGFSG